MSSINVAHLLDTVDIPEGLIVEIVTDPAVFFGQKVVLNKGSTYWFGSAMRQGNRLQFLCTMPVQDYLNIVQIDQAKRGSTVSELKDHMNRPKIPSQQTAIKDYLKETACAGDKWIFPNLIVNYGVGRTADMPRAKLILLVTDSETLAWPAIFSPPTGVKMPPTDGAHRTGSVEDLIRQRPPGVEELLANGVGVTFVMEGSNDDRQQDFTDCGKSRPISESIKATWDKRNVVVRAARELVLGNPFLHDYIDATSASVNLGSNSSLIWSMSAVRGSLINAYCNRVEDFDKLDAKDKDKLLTRAPVEIGQFIDELVVRVPIFIQLKDGSATPAVFRKQLGGCVLMRGAGFGILMRAFRYAMDNGLKASEMAEKLAEVDWFALDVEWQKDMDLGGPSLYDWLKVHAKAPWFRLIAVNPGDGSWRLKGTNENLDAAFQVLMAPPPAQAQAAE